MTDRKISRIECIPASFFLFSYMYGMVNEFELSDRNYGEQNEKTTILTCHDNIFAEISNMVAQFFPVFADLSEGSERGGAFYKT